MGKMASIGFSVIAGIMASVGLWMAGVNPGASVLLGSSMVTFIGAIDFMVNG